MKKISESYLSIRTLPPLCKEEDKRLFIHEAERQIDPVYQIGLSGMLFTDYGLFQVPRKKYFPHQLFNYNHVQRLETVRYWVYKISLFLRQKLVTIKEPVLLVTDYWSAGYFHWMAEVLPRLVIAKEHGLQGRVLLDTRFRKLRYVVESLKQIGFEPLFTTPEKVHRLKTLQFVSHFTLTGNFHDLWLQKTRTLLQTRAFTNCRNRIYISRKLASKRRVANEQELKYFLLENGFTIVETELLSFQEQRELFSGCDFLVSIHGAGLTNMMFMNPGATVVEFRLAVDCHNNCYFSMASALQINYHYLECTPLHAGENQHTADLIVDNDSFERLVYKILN